MIPENRCLIAQAFEQGRDAPGIAAYHGTSLQVLKEIIRTGVQTSSTVASPANRLGDVFIYPIKDSAIVPFEMEMFDEEMAFKKAKEYAGDIAIYDGLAERLGLDFAKARHETFDALLKNPPFRVDSGHIRYANNESLYQLLAERATNRKWDKKEAVAIMEIVAELQGVVLGYSQRVLDLGSPLPTNENSKEKEAVRVINPPIGSIVCVEPLDQESYDYLSSLEQR